MKFEPYIFSPEPISQGIIYLIRETIGMKFFPDKFNREEIVLPEDGGTIGLDWDGPIPTPEEMADKPLLVICPGLGGGSHNLYSLGLLHGARKDGFRCVTLLFRGA